MPVRSKSVQKKLSFKKSHTVTKNRRTTSRTKKTLTKTFLPTPKPSKSKTNTRSKNPKTRHPQSSPIKVSVSVTKNSTPTPQTLQKQKINELTKRFELLPHQVHDVKHMLNHRGLILYHHMGTGKTRTAIASIVALNIPAVVVIPASVRGNFQDELNKLKLSDHEKELFQVVSFQYFIEHTCASSDSPFKPGLPTQHKIKAVPTLTLRDKILVVDEAHMLRNEQGTIHRSIARCAEQAAKIMLLTGTPVLNAPRDISPLLNLILKKHMRLEISMGFFQKPLVWHRLPTGQEFDKWMGVSGIETKVARQVWKKVLPCCFSYYTAPRSEFYPTIVLKNIMVPMSEPQAEIYEKWEKRQLTREMAETLKSQNWKKNQDLTSIPSFLNFFTGGRKIANVASWGAPLEVYKDHKNQSREIPTSDYQSTELPTEYESEDFWEPQDLLQEEKEKPVTVIDKDEKVPTVRNTQKNLSRKGWLSRTIYEYESHPKMDYIVEYLKKHPEQAIVYSNFLSQGIYVLERLFLVAGITYVKFTGQENDLEKVHAKQAYNGKKVQVFLMSSAGGLGLNLRNSDSIHILEPHWNPGKIDQAIYRGVRIHSHDKPGAKVKVFCYYATKPTKTFSSFLANLKPWLHGSSGPPEKNKITDSADIVLLKISKFKEKMNNAFLKKCIQYSIEQKGHECLLKKSNDI